MKPSHQCFVWGSGKATLRTLCNIGTERESSQNKGKERSFQKRLVLKSCSVIPCFGVNNSKQHYLHFWYIFHVTSIAKYSKSSYFFKILNYDMKIWQSLFQWNCPFPSIIHLGEKWQRERDSFRIIQVRAHNFWQFPQFQYPLPRRRVVYVWSKEESIGQSKIKHVAIHAASRNLPLNIQPIM